MAHVITFHNQDHQDVLVKMINMGYGPMMKLEGNTTEYFKSFVGECRFWSFKHGGFTWDAEYVDISFGAPNAETDWNGVADWLTGNQEVLPLIKPVKAKSIVTEEDDELSRGPYSDQYMYEEKILGGIFFAEIIKPQTDRPYTIVIEDWTPDKMVYMFSSICSVPSFGVLYPEDRNFIVSLWNWKGMEGKFDLQLLADRHVRAVEKGETHEPVVYRKPVGEIIDRFTEHGTGSKRKLFEVPPK